MACRRLLGCLWPSAIGLVGIFEPIWHRVGGVADGKSVWYAYLPNTHSTYNPSMYPISPEIPAKSAPQKATLE